MVKRRVPNVVRGGAAVPIGRNYYYMTGRKHENGGIDIGKNPCTGLEVEDGEVMHVGKDEIKVFSAQPFLNGESPAQRVMRGDNPNDVFNAQERFKKRNKLNDDGTKKKRMGGLSRDKDYGSSKKPYPNVKSKDFAGKHRSYPIPTKDDARDALRLAGLHGRSDIKAKVYAKYPDLRKKARNGGLYSVTVNGTTKLKMFSSMGKVNDKRRKYELGGNDKDYITVAGIKHYKGDTVSYKGKTYLVTGRNEMKEIEPINTFTNISTNSKQFKPKNTIYDYTPYNPIINTQISSSPLTIPANRVSVPNNTISNSNIRNSINSKPINNSTNIINNNVNNNVNKKIKQIPIIESLSVPNIPSLRVNNISLPTSISKINIPEYRNTTYSNNIYRRIKNYINDNPGTINDAIGLTSNIIGGIIGNRINNKMLNNLKFNSAPIPRRAAKLKTRININPQLDKMRESLASYERNVDENTGSSQVALARKQRARLANILQTNELFGNKENIETELINRDKLNQQIISNRNIEDYNNWDEKRAAFENAILNQKAENNVSLLNTINTGIQDIIARREKRNSESQTRKVMMAGYPNVNPRLLRNLGIKGISDEDIANWDKAYGNKRRRKTKSNDNED